MKRFCDSSIWATPIAAEVPCPADIFSSPRALLGGGAWETFASGQAGTTGLTQFGHAEVDFQPPGVKGSPFCRWHWLQVIYKLWSSFLPGIDTSFVRLSNPNLMVELSLKLQDNILQMHDPWCSKVRKKKICLVIIVHISRQQVQYPVQPTLTWPPTSPPESVRVYSLWHFHLSTCWEIGKNNIYFSNMKLSPREQETRTLRTFGSNILFCNLTAPWRSLRSTMMLSTLRSSSETSSLKFLVVLSTFSRLAFRFVNWWFRSWSLRTRKMRLYVYAQS